MSMLVLSRHSETRMRQRGMRPRDLELVWRCGSASGDYDHEVYFLKHKDAQREIDRLSGEIRRQTRSQGPSAHMDRGREIHRLKRELHMLERLRGRKLVVADGTVVTCYRSNRRDRKRMFRKGWGGARPSRARPSNAHSMTRRRQVDDDTIERLLRELEEESQLKKMRQEHTYVEDLMRLCCPTEMAWLGESCSGALRDSAGMTACPFQKNFEQAVQSAYNQNCVDSAVFKKRGLPNSAAPFFSPEGSGSGIWAVDPERAEQWLRKRRCGDDV